MTQAPKVASPVPLKRFAEPVLGKMLQPGKNAPDDKLVPYLKAGHVQWSGIDIPEDLPLMWASPSDVAGLQPSKGDLLVCEGGEVGRAALVQEALPEETIIQNSLHLIREGALAYPPYLKYAIEHIAASGWLDLICNKATIAHLTVDKLRALPIPYWTHPAQTRIANFLDEKTARIDALIAEKERLVERVGEQADAQVSDLVCGSGLSHESYRETGWRFLPKIPAHWQLCHLRWIAKRVDVGIAEAATHAYADEGVPILRSTNVRPNSIAGTLLRIQPWFAEKNSSKTLYENDLVTVRTGYPGVTAVVPKELDGCQCFTLLISSLEDGYLPSFYARYLNAAAARGYFAVESWGSAQQNISVPILKELYVPRLPLDEQRVIVAECERVDAASQELASHVLKHISLLREYRSSLISAAVTGQLSSF